MEFERLFKSEFERLGGLVLPLVGDGQEVEVMVSEAFARLWEKRDTVYQQEAIEDFLENAMLGQAVRFMVDNRKSSSDGDSQPALGDLAGVIAALPTHARASWVLAREGKLNFTQIGEMLDLSAETVAKQLGKALRLVHKGMTGQAQPADLDLKEWSALCEQAGKALAGESIASLDAQFPEEHPQRGLVRQMEAWWQAGASQGLTFNSDTDQNWQLFLDIVPGAKGGKIIDHAAVRKRRMLIRKWRLRLILGGIAAVIIFLLYLLVRWIF